MYKSPSKSTIKTRPVTYQNKSEASILDQSAKAFDYLQDLYNMRLIDNIARPRQRSYKQNYLSDFSSKLQRLHELMSKIKSQLSSYGTSKKGIFGSQKNVIKKSVGIKKYIRSIQARYTQVLIEGSFKFCKKVCDTFGLNYNSKLQIIAIDQWARSCLQDPVQQSCC